MVANYALTEQERRVPFGPSGFSHLNRPSAQMVFDVPGGQMHHFTGLDYLANLDVLREAAVELHMSIFGIPYWEAMREVFHNMKRRDGSSVSFFEPDKSLKLQVLQQRGRERVASSAPNRLISPTDPEIRLINPFGGYASQENRRVNTGEAIRGVMGFTTVALQPEYTGQGIGRSLFRIPIYLYKPNIVWFRTQTGAVPSALEQAGVTEGKRQLYGVDFAWHTNSEMYSLGSHFRANTLNPNGFNEDEFISIAVYPEGLNMAYDFEHSQGRAREVDEIFHRKGVVVGRGDGAFVAGYTIFKERGRQRLQQQALPLSA